MKIIQFQELTSSQASITFSSIPQTYTDLYLVISSRTNFGATTSSLGIFLNSAAADTSYRYLRGTGTASNSTSDSGRQDFYIGETPATNNTSSTFGSHHVYIPNYATSQPKIMNSEGVTENNSTAAFQFISVGQCTKTAAITSVTVRGFEGTSGDLVQYTSATLYGITKGSDGIVTVS
jgi:hypothetical protein